WLDLDQAELDAAYDQTVWAPNREQLVRRYATQSDAVRARLGGPRRFAYGAAPVEGLDLYAAGRASAPINVFIHGGAWRAGLAKGGLCSSGMYDLEAVRLSARSNYVKFTDEMEQALSAQRHLDKLSAPIVVSYGTLESPEFQRQARDFAAAVTAAGKPVKLLVGEDYNHFEIIETLGTPYGHLGRAALELMKLPQGDG